MKISLFPGGDDCLHLTSFTCVLEFVVDPALERCDVVFGLGWSRQCEVAGMLSLAVSSTSG
jgi:hypothetical protein